METTINKYDIILKIGMLIKHVETGTIIKINHFHTSPISGAI